MANPGAADVLHLWLLAGGWPRPVTEHRFATPRRWRFDYAWLERKIALEIEGGTRGRGRHNRHDGYSRDCEKYNQAQLLGWRVFRFTTEQMKSGDFMPILEKLLV